MASQLALYVSEGPDLVHYSIDAEGATLDRRGAVSAPHVIQYAWVHPMKRFIYAASSSGVRGTEHHVSAFRIGQDGALYPHGEPVRLAYRPIHLTVDETGRYLLIAYNRPSSATVHLIDPDGHIGQLIEQPQGLEGGTYAHQVRVLPSNRAAVLVARGTHKPGIPANPGSLQVYDFQDGVFSNAQTVAPSHEFSPRHLDFHPTKLWVYISLEHENTLQVYALDKDHFSVKPLFSQSLLAEPDNVRPRQMGGAIHVHPNGRYVYVANRSDHRTEHAGKEVFGGGENSIAVFEIDPVSGEARRIQLADTGSFYVRCFALDPTGRILVAPSLIEMDVLESDVVHHVPRTITIFRIGSDGRLTVARKLDVETGEKRQWWVNIVALPA